MKKKAQSILEYAIILGVIAVVSVQILGKFGSPLAKIGNRANAEINNTNSPDSYCKKIGCSGFDAGNGKCSNCP